MTTRWLLDSNVLIALTLPQHEHHLRANRWIGENPLYATCPITQGALVRALIRFGLPPSSISKVLGVISDDPSHQFEPDDLSFAACPLDGITGHRQVTDRYLAQLAKKRNLGLVTFDVGLATSNPGVQVIG